MADIYYIVDCGREVGIFTDEYVTLIPRFTALTVVASELSARAVVGVPGGRRIKVKTWYEAASIYNSLLDEGIISRVRA